MSYQPRIPIRFSNVADTEDVDFPLANYSFEAATELYVPEAALTGAHGGFDLLGDGVPVKQSGVIRLSCEVVEDSPSAVETTVDDVLDKVFRLGRGVLWTSGLDAFGAEALRWTRARATAMPRVEWSAGDILQKRLTLGFRHEPYWYSEDALYADPITISTDPQTVVVNNTGTARIYNAVLTVAGTFGPVQILNQTNGYRVRSTRTGADPAIHLRFDAGAPAVLYSNDDGVTWSGDWANYVRLSGKIAQMVFEPGNNTIEVSGLSGELTIDAYPAWH